MNPLKIKDELVNKHGFYEFKVKQFLMALALGMRPAKIYTGQDSAVEGILLMDGSGGSSLLSQVRETGYGGLPVLEYPFGERFSG